MTATPRRISQPKKRSCPLCGHLGFASTGKDFHGRPTFQCNACRHDWATERGPLKGTGPHRIAEQNWEDS